MQISHVSESPTKKYSKAVRNAKTLAELRKAVKSFARVADDAVRLVDCMDESDFKEFHKDLPKMRNEKVKPKEVDRLVVRWGDLVMPFKLIWSEIVADKYMVPWGTAFLRCEELGWPKKK